MYILFLYTLCNKLQVISSIPFLHIWIPNNTYKISIFAEMVKPFSVLEKYTVDAGSLIPESKLSVLPVIPN